MMIWFRSMYSVHCTHGCTLYIVHTIYICVRANRMPIILDKKSQEKEEDGEQEENEEIPQRQLNNCWKKTSLLIIIMSKYIFVQWKHRMECIHRLRNWMATSANRNGMNDKRVEKKKKYYMMELNLGIGYIGSRIPSLFPQLLPFLCSLSLLPHTLFQYLFMPKWMAEVKIGTQNEAAGDDSTLHVRFFFSLSLLQFCYLLSNSNSTQ